MSLFELLKGDKVRYASGAYQRTPPLEGLTAPAYATTGPVEITSAGFRSLRDGKIADEVSCIEPNPTASFAANASKASLFRRAVGVTSQIKRWAHAYIELAIAESAVATYTRIAALQERPDVALGIDLRGQRLLMRRPDLLEWSLPFEILNDPNSDDHEKRQMIVAESHSAFARAREFARIALPRISVTKVLPQTRRSPCDIPEYPSTTLTKDDTPAFAYLGGGLSTVLTVPHTGSIMTLPAYFQLKIGGSIATHAATNLARIIGPKLPRELPTVENPVWGYSSLDGFASSLFLALMLDPRVRDNPAYGIALPHRDEVLLINLNSPRLNEIGDSVLETFRAGLRPISAFMYRVIDGYLEEI